MGFMLNKCLIVCRIIASPPCHSLASISRRRVVLCMPLFGGAEGDGRPTLTEKGYLMCPPGENIEQENVHL